MISVETFPFQAETRQLLDLMINSLYTNREIFLRELISNASDALDRLRFEALTRPELLDGERLEIRLDADRESRTLTIQDNGIGMSREEVIADIGTIAKSGTRELRDRLQDEAAGEAVSDLIGQFGVGFYSCFMAADRVTLLTRRAGEEKATQWESGGDGEYRIREAAKAGRGTSITLHLKPPDAESGLEDFTDKWILARIIKRYSDFVGYPVIYKDQREEADGSEGPKTIVIEDKVLNSMKPLWAKPQADVTQEEYAQFYKHLTHNQEGPLRTVHLKAEGKLEYHALLFIPARAPDNLYYHGFEAGLRLYAKGVMIKERCAELLPRYLRFINGVVDSAELPLNISRQMLQQDQHVTLMRKWLTKKVLDTLHGLYEREPDEFLRFWEQFGRAFKEGVGSDYDNKEKIISLLHFESSADQAKLTTLKGYVERMPEGQQEIFYLTGESRQVVENSPHLEALTERGCEVLYLIDPVDELVVQSLTSFEGKKLKSVGKGWVDIGGESDEASSADELKKKEEECAELLELLQKRLDAHIKHVRLSNRLTTSPVCLVGAEHDYSPQLERLLQKGKGAGPKQRRIMELNPQHPVFIKMHERVKKDKDDPVPANYAELLLGYALLAEGSELHDPVRFNQLVADLIVQSL
jgi:molecular chaperone HtpG